MEHGEILEGDWRGFGSEGNKSCTGHVQLQDEDWMKKERTQLLADKAEMLCLPVHCETYCPGKPE